jgi:cytoskeleton protein RodZ
MASIGEMLCEAREAQGRSIEDLAAELCITKRYLRAIEEDDVKSLPGLFFYQSFARQYAAMLGIEANQIGDALAALNGPPAVAGAESQEAAAGSPSTQTAPAQTSFSRRSFSELSSSALSSSALSSSSYSPSLRTPSLRAVDPIIEGANRGYFAGYPVGLSAAALVAAVLLGSGIFAWWSRPPQPAPSAASAPAKVAERAAEGSAREVSSAAVAPSLEATAAVDDGNQVVLNLSANEKTWLSITSHGKVIFSGILEASQSKTLKGGEVATMKIGNAGGVDIQWNGKSIGPIGPRGQVRTVRFTRQDFHVLSPEDLAPPQPARDDL